MPERDTGQDKTDKQNDKSLSEEALRAQNRMPFFEPLPEVVYSPRDGKTED